MFARYLAAAGHFVAIPLLDAGGPLAPLLVARVKPKPRERLDHQGPACPDCTRAPSFRWTEIAETPLESCA